MGTELIALRPGDTDLLKQLTHNDLVHDFGTESVPRLVKYRVGREGDQKQAFALIDPETREVYAAIYGTYFSTPVRTPADIPGDAHAILNAPCAPMDAEPTGIIFYSVTALLKPDGRTLRLKGSGKMLLNALMDYADRGGLPAGIVRSTLSPARFLVEKYPFLAGKMARSGNILPYTLALHEAIWGDYFVWRTHMECGAQMGDLKCDANTPGSLDDKKGAGMMVNLVYPEATEERRKNMAAFQRARSGDGCKVELLSGHLKTRIGVNFPVVAAAMLRQKTRRVRLDAPTPSPQS